MAFHQTRILRESTGGNNDGARRHLDVVGDNADNPTVFLDQLLHPCSEDDLDPVLTTSLVQHLNQSVSLILGHVAAPDVLDAGLGESRLVSVTRDRRGNLDAESDEPFQCRTGVFAECTNQSG